MYNVFLALGSHPAFGAGGSIGAGFEELVAVDYLGTDKLLLKVGMDGLAGLWRGGISLSRPCPALLLSSGEEGNEI